MKYAAIDIGTNTFRLLIAEITPESSNECISFREIHSEGVITRLGEGLSDDGLLNTSAMERSISALKEFKRLITEHKAKHVLAVATSALRNARNSREFLERVRGSAGIEIEVITGEKEAELTAAGMLIDIQRPASSLMVDIGGGSTELIFMRNNSPLTVQSIDLGVVHLAEKYMTTDPPSANGLNKLEQEIIAGLKTVCEIFSCLIDQDTVLMGTAGTITALAAALQHLNTYTHKKIHHYRMNIRDIQSIYSAMTGMTTAERSKLLPFEPSRLDIIVPGTRILLTLMSTFSFNEMIVSNYGLREGILAEIHIRGHTSH